MILTEKSTSSWDCCSIQNQQSFRQNVQLRKWHFLETCNDNQTWKFKLTSFPVASILFQSRLPELYWTRAGSNRSITERVVGLQMIFTSQNESNVEHWAGPGGGPGGLSDLPAGDPLWEAGAWWDPHKDIVSLDRSLSISMSLHRTLSASNTIPQKFHKTAPTVRGG